MSSFLKPLLHAPLLANADQSLEAQIPTQNPEIPKKNRVYTNFFEKFAFTLSLLFSSDTSQEPNGNCSDRLVQMNFFFLYIWVEF